MDESRIPATGSAHSRLTEGRSRRYESRFETVPAALSLVRFKLEFRHLRSVPNTPMRTPPLQYSKGIVAILDALGAASYSDDDVERFVESRTVVLGQLNEKAEGVLGEIKADMVKTFTFNDTVLVILNTGTEDPNLRRISQFFMIMRKFLVDSLAKKILFRGSIAIGTFYADDGTNTVMGQAVTDAAAWYDKADWIGVHTTPRTNLVINRCLEHEAASKEHVMLDYPVPLKNGAVIRTKAVNWPKVFFVESIKPCAAGAEKEKLLEFLTRHPVPWGTESKFSNTLAFFDHAVKQLNSKKKKHQPTTQGIDE